MDYAPYLVACRDQTLASAYEKFLWQEFVPRQEPTTRRRRTGRRDAAAGGISNNCHDRCHGDAQVPPPPNSWHRFATEEISSALDSVRNALSWRPAATPADKEGAVTAGSASTTPPAVNGTPATGRSAKKVSFADEMGLALTSVRTICGDSVSSSCCLSSSFSVLQANGRRSTVASSRFLMKFALPWSTDSDAFRQKVASCNVILSRFVIRNGVINGDVEVKDIAYEKSVFVRYTGNDWKSFSDVGASYSARSEQKFPGYDTFSFQFPVPLDPEKTSGRMEFAVCYVASGHAAFWDNNRGRNYEVVKVEGPKPPSDDAILQEFQNWGLDTPQWEKGICSAGGNGGGGKALGQLGRQQKNATDRIDFSVLQPRPVGWTEFVGWKWDMNYNLPYW